jgi:hypothetical protein
MKARMKCTGGGDDERHSGGGLWRVVSLQVEIVFRLKFMHVVDH